MRSKAFVSLLVVAVALAAAAPRAQAAVRVVATVPSLASLAQAVAGPDAAVKSLTRASQDPHFVDARPSLALELNHAQLLLVVGLNLEVGWLPTLQTGARNADIQVGGRGYLDCSRFVALLETHGQPLDRSMGDIHPGGNPHYQNDPRAMAAVARGIAEKLAELDPPHASGYRARAATLVKQIDDARAGWEKRLAPLRGTPVVGYHKTWAYLANWLGLVEVGFLEPKPGIPPNPSHVAQLLALARERRVRAILQEEYYPDNTSRLVAAKIPATLLKFPGGPDAPAETYVHYMDRVFELLASVLGGPAGGAR